MKNHNSALKPILEFASSGEDDQAELKLENSLISEMRKLAEVFMRNERRDHTLQPSALVNEVYLRLANYQGITTDQRTIFLKVASKVMRRVLVDHARKKSSKKRFGECTRVELVDPAESSGQSNQTIGILEIDELLEKLSELHPRAADIVELKFFSGMNNEEMAHSLKVSSRTIRNDWQFAKAWLYRENANLVVQFSMHQGCSLKSK